MEEIIVESEAGDADAGCIGIGGEQRCRSVCVFDLGYIQYNMRWYGI